MPLLVDRNEFRGNPQWEQSDRAWNWAFHEVLVHTGATFLTLAAASWLRGEGYPVNWGQAVGTGGIELLRHVASTPLPFVEAGALVVGVLNNFRRAEQHGQLEESLKNQ